MSKADEWARAYARQASADLDTWNILQTQPSVPTCHKLLFLQMACEKLTKAHLCRAGSDPRQLQTSHAYVAKNLPIVVRQQMAELGSSVRGKDWVLQHSKHLAQEIEMLAPAVNRSL